jgi:hypothetical protein
MATMTVPPAISTAEPAEPMAFDSAVGLSWPAARCSR